MLTPLENCPLYGALKNYNLESAYLTREIKPQEWMCYSGNWTLVVRYQQGILGLGVGETEYEANGHISAIAIDYDRTEDHYCMTPIAFGEVLAFMGWEIDEDRCGDLNAGQLPLEQARAAVPATQI